MSETVPDPQQSRQCAKCGSAMEIGFIIDQTRGGPVAPNWISGEVEYGFFGLKTSGRDRHPVQTFRCVGCGYLESFAPQAGAAVSKVEDVRRTFQRVFPQHSTDQNE
jgi:hypothetical protein